MLEQDMAQRMRGVVRNVFGRLVLRDDEKPIRPRHGVRVSFGDGASVNRWKFGHRGNEIITVPEQEHLDGKLARTRLADNLGKAREALFQVRQQPLSFNLARIGNEKEVFGLALDPFHILLPVLSVQGGKSREDAENKKDSEELHGAPIIAETRTK